MNEIKIITPDQLIDEKIWTQIQLQRLELRGKYYNYAKLLTSGYQDQGKIKQTFVSMESIGELENERKKLKTIYLLAKEKDHVLGFASMMSSYAVPFNYWRYLDNKFNDIIFLDHIFISEEARNGGIGTKLLNVCKNYSFDNKFKNLLLGVFFDNKTARNFYEKNRFSSIERLFIYKINQRQIRKDCNWKIIDASDKYHITRLNSFIYKQVENDCSLFPQIGYIKEKIVESIINQINKGDFKVYGYSEGKDDYIICKSLSGVLKIYYSLFSDGLLSMKCNISKLIHSINNITKNEQWLSQVSMQSKFDRTLLNCGYEPYLYLLSCPL